jgi:HD-like signal output (HDOD) protein
MNSASIQELITQHTQLRAPPSVLPVLLEALADEEIEYDELGEAIEQFPSIAARLLSVANSAWSAPRVEITSVDRACAHLGLTLTRNISIALAVSMPFDLMRCPLFDPGRYWCSAFLVADGAERLARRCESATRIEPRTLHTAGLLHNLGLLWLADRLPQDLMRVFELVSADDTLTVNEALHRVCATDIGEVGGCLARAWSLPGILATAIAHYCAIDYAGEDWAAPAMIGNAAGMASALQDGLDCPAEAPPLDRLGISLIDRQEIFEKMRSELDRIRELANSLSRF